MEGTPGPGGTFWHLMVWAAEWGSASGMGLLLWGQQLSRHGEERQLFRLPLTGMRAPSSREPPPEI